MKHRVILAVLLSCCTLLPVLSQTTAQTTPQTTQSKPADDRDDVVKITTNLVQIDAVVTKDGKPVPGLKAEDFEIYEDGRRQTITSFAYILNTGPSASAAPDKIDKRTVPGIPGAPAGPIQRDVPRRTIAIVVDDLGLSAESMGQVRRQLRKFVAEQIEPNDLVAIIRTGGEMGALQQFTTDTRLLSRAVEQLRWNVCSRVGTSVFNRVGDGDNLDPCGGRSFGKTRKALEFILDAMGQLPGRKSLILMSDSIPIENQETQIQTDGSLSEARQLSQNAGSISDAGFVSVGANSTNYYWALRKIAEKAIRSSVVIYSVDTQGLQYTGITAADSVNTPIRQGEPQIKQILVTRSNTLLRRREGGDMIAKQTGGFQVRNSNGFQLDRIMEDQSGYYLIGYRPTDETFNRKFHHVKAKVKRSGMTVRTRFGFFGISEEDAERARPTPNNNTNLALLSPFGSQDLELDLDAFFANSKNEGSIVRSFVYLNAANLTFTPVNDRHETSLELHGVIFGDNGVIVEQIKQGAVLSLRQGEYEQALRNGLRLRVDMPAKRPGSYQVRIAVRDRNSSKIGSAGEFVAVPDLRNNQLAMSGVVLRAASETAEGAVVASSAGQRFRINSEVEFAFAIYNASIDPATQSPNLVMETKLFRDGKTVKSSAGAAISGANQPDLTRIVISGVMRLQEDLEPGNYYLQVVITDKARNKQPPVMQWVDFEIVK